MSKNKKRNQQKRVFLSPENKIKKKSRNLPIVKCTVNKGWEYDGLASILIVRRHGNGNVTFCCYLVDKNCLGVKDTIYWVNEPQEVLDEYEEKITSSYEVEEISYELAHNIIFAAIEFAEEYGFKPHRNFLSVTQYFLEEDDDNIPLIDVHCGNKNGEPVYVDNGYETPALKQRIINQLDKTAGKGNYDVYVNITEGRLKENYLDEDEFDNEFEKEKEDGDGIYNRWYEKFMRMEDRELIIATHKSFIEWVKAGGAEDYDRFDNDEFIEKMRALTDIWSEDYMYDQDKIDDYHDKITSDLENIDTVNTENVPNSLFPTFVRGGKKLSDDFIELFLKIHANSKQKEVWKSIAEFVLKYKDCEAATYIKCMFNVVTKTNKRDDIEKELERFPDYFMLNLLQKENEIVKMSPERARVELLNLTKGRTLTTFEMSRLLLNYVIYVFRITDVETPERLEKLEALEKLFNSDFAEYKSIYTGKLLLKIIRILKINYLISRIVKDKKEN